MKELEVIRSSTGTPSRLVSSRMRRPATISALDARTAEPSTTFVAGSTTVSFDRTSPSRLFSSRARHSRWATVRDAMSVAGLAAARAQPVPVTPVAAGSVESASGEIEIRAAAAERSPDAASEGGRASLAPATRATGVGPSRIELTIDSLRSYELIRPIPVFVEALGERHYVAEVPDINITTSGGSLSEILIVLKNSITQTYDELRVRKVHDPEQARRLKSLETYIGKAKRGGWLDRR